HTFIEKTVAENPFTFIYGVGMMLPKFEQEIEGLAAGDKKTFTLTPQEGYGEKAENATTQLPAEMFVQSGMPPIGAILPLQDQDGNHLSAVVTEVARSEERRVGKECRCRWSPEQHKNEERRRETQERARVPHAVFFFSSRRRHTRFSRDWSSDVCSSDLRKGMERRLKTQQRNFRQKCSYSPECHQSVQSFPCRTRTETT